MSAVGGGLDDDPVAIALKDRLSLFYGALIARRSAPLC